jgi:1-acyl-sn-glycerol-3-phosphate acyltransferase
MRAFVVVPVAVLATLLFGGYVLAAGLFDRSGSLAFGGIRCWARLLLRLCAVRVVVSRERELPAPAVFAANHTSAADILLVFGFVPAEFRIIHKRSLRWVPLVGWCLWAAGHVSIDRTKVFRARRSLELAARRIRGGTSVVVFPEGTRSRDGRVGLFKRGSFLLAIQAGVPVVPVSLIGVRRVAPHGLLSLRPGKVEVRLHAPVATAGRAAEEAEALAEEVKSQVVSGLSEAE